MSPERIAAIAVVPGVLSRTTQHAPAPGLAAAARMKPKNHGDALARRVVAEPADDAIEQREAPAEFADQFEVRINRGIALHRCFIEPLFHSRREEPL